MTAHLAGILDGVLVGAVAFGLGGWQLWSLRREQARDREAAERRRSAEGAGHPVGEHRLDDR